MCNEYVEVETDCRMKFNEHYNTDKHAATRRAIVRAAAAIGAEL